MKITLGAVVEGGTSIDYQTGNWRDHRPLIHIEDCTGCGICHEVWPDSSVQVRGEPAGDPQWNSLQALADENRRKFGLIRMDTNENKGTRGVAHDTGPV